MYWLNAFGCFVGWIAVRLLWTRYVNGGALGGMDVLLTLVAFLGLIGWLPYAVMGLAMATRNASAKLLDLVSPVK
jgi:hypothetical protein